jgi:hypothetical protein
MRKKKEERPLPPMLVGDEERTAAERLPDLAGKSLVLPEVPRVIAEEQQARGPNRGEAGKADDDENEIFPPGCLAWMAVTVSILAFLKETDLPGELEGILALIVLVAAPGLYSWITMRDERRRARQSRVSTSESPVAHVAVPPSEDPPAAP